MSLVNYYAEAIVSDSKTRAKLAKEIKKLAKEHGYSEKQVRKYLYHSQRGQNETGANQQAGERPSSDEQIIN